MSDSITNSPEGVAVANLGSAGAVQSPSPAPSPAEPAAAQPGVTPSTNVINRQIDLQDKNIPIQTNFDSVDPENLPQYYAFAPEAGFAGGKYKNVYELEKGYINQSKLLGTFTGAPGEYKYDSLNTDNFAFDTNDANLKKFESLGRELNLSQSGFEKILNTFKEYTSSIAPNVEDEIAKLGDNAQERVNSIDNWVSTNLSDQGKELYSKLTTNLGADVLLLVDEIRKMPAPQEAPAQLPQAHLYTGPTGLDAHVKSYDMERAAKDPGYRKAWQERLKQYIGDK